MQSKKNFVTSFRFVTLSVAVAFNLQIAKVWAAEQNMSAAPAGFAKQIQAELDRLEEASRETKRANALMNRPSNRVPDQGAGDVLIDEKKPGASPKKTHSAGAQSTTTLDKKTPEQTDNQCNGYAQSAASTCSSSLSSVNSINQSVSGLNTNMSDSPAVACAQIEQTSGNASSQMDSLISSCRSAVTSCISKCNSDNDTCNEANVTLQSMNTVQANLNATTTSARRCRSEGTTGESNAQAKMSAADGSAFANLNSGSGSSGSIYNAAATGQGGSAIATPTQGMAVPQTVTGSSSAAGSNSGNTLGTPEDVNSLVNSKYQKSEMTTVAQQTGGTGKVSAARATPTASRDALQLKSGQGSKYDTNINAGGYDESGGRRTRYAANNNWDSASSYGGYARRRPTAKADSATEQVDLNRFLPQAGGKYANTFGPGGVRRGPASAEAQMAVLGGPPYQYVPHTQIPLQSSTHGLLRRPLI